MAGAAPTAASTEMAATQREQLANTCAASAAAAAAGSGMASCAALSRATPAAKVCSKLRLPSAAACCWSPAAAAVAAVAPAAAAAAAADRRRYWRTRTGMMCDCRRAAPAVQGALPPQLIVDAIASAAAKAWEPASQVGPGIRVIGSWWRQLCGKEARIRRAAPLPRPTAGRGDCASAGTALPQILCLKDFPLRAALIIPQ